MLVVSQELKDAFLKLEFWEAEYRNIRKHLSLKFMCFYSIIYLFIFNILLSSYDFGWQHAKTEGSVFRKHCGKVSKICSATI